MLRRLVQVWHYLISRPSPEALRDAAMTLSGPELTLFARMRPSDQAHAARVAGRLRAAGAPRDVVAAGYLHDAGKPADFTLAWRAFAVLSPAPRPAAEPPARKPWVRARQIYHWHGHYAARLLEEAGSPGMVSALVRGEPCHPWAEALRRADDLG